jgi:hypothetical protein
MALEQAKQVGLQGVVVHRNYSCGQAAIINPLAVVELANFERFWPRAPLAISANTSRRDDDRFVES